MKTIAIIGGSYGIGNAIAKEMSQSNQVITMCRSNLDKLDNHQHYQIDVLADQLPEIESLNGLVYCPGSINLKPFKRFKLDDFKSDFEINVLGAVKVIQHYLRALANGNGSVVMFSTVASQMGMPFHASIASSKSAVEGLAKSLAAEFANQIRFNVVAPTVTDTPLAQKLLKNDKQKELMKERHPLKHYLQPEKVSKLVTYLLSDDASAISGRVFTIDAGLVTIKT